MPPVVRVLVAAAGDHGSSPAPRKLASHCGVAVAAVTEDLLWAHTRPSSAGSADVPACKQRLDVAGLVALAARDDGGQRLAPALGAEVEFRENPSRLRSSASSACPPTAPAACCCARTTVPSTKCVVQSSRPARSAARCRMASTRAHTPAALQRRKRFQAVDHGPTRSGRSRHGAPVRSTDRIAPTTVGWSRDGRPVRGRCGGNSGPRAAHSTSVNSALRHAPSYPGVRGFAHAP
jgi:hypothetical protein